MLYHTLGLSVDVLYVDLSSREEASETARGEQVLVKDQFNPSQKSNKFAK